MPVTPRGTLLTDHTSAADASVSVPADSEATDLEIAFCGSNFFVIDSGSDLQPSGSGWALRFTVDRGTDDSKVRVWTRTAPAGAHTITLSTLGGEEIWLAVRRLIGVDLNNPVIDVDGATAANQNHIAPALDLGAEEGYLIGAAMCQVFQGGSTYTPPSGFTELVEITLFASSATATVAEDQSAGPGTVGSFNFVYSTVDPGLATVIAIRASGPAGTTAPVRPGPAPGLFGPDSLPIAWDGASETPPNLVSVDVNAVAPMPTAVSEIDVQVKLDGAAVAPLPTVSSDIGTDIEFGGGVTAPLPTVSADINIDVEIIGGVTAPMPVVSGLLGQSVLEIDVTAISPMSAASGALDVHATLNATVNVPMSTVLADIGVDTELSGAAIAPMPTIVADIDVRGAINGAAIAPIPIVAGTIGTQSQVDTTAVAPIPTVASDIDVRTSLVGAAIAPMPTVFGLVGEGGLSDATILVGPSRTSNLAESSRANTVTVGSSRIGSAIVGTSREAGSDLLVSAGRNDGVGTGTSRANTVDVDGSRSGSVSVGQSRESRGE
jgi:hypothetical protein